MTEFANDTVTEQALARLAENARITIARLQVALEAAKGVRYATRLAGDHGLTEKGLGKIQAESLRLSSALNSAGAHNDLVTGNVLKLDKHRTEALHRNDAGMSDEEHATARRASADSIMRAELETRAND
jgi:hypothetical protein